MNGQTAQAVDIIAEQAARITELERQLSESRATVAGGVDWLGLALDLEAQAKRVESRTVERAMKSAAHGLRLMGAAQQVQASPVAWACWATGAEQKPEHMQLCAYEPKAYPNRRALTWAGAATPAQPQALEGDSPDFIYEGQNGADLEGSFEGYTYGTKFYTKPQVQPAGDAKDAALSADDVEWIVNDNAELGVKIRGQFFFLYKGHSLVYEDCAHDDGRPMMWRRVFKREFGECCHPVNYADPTKWGTVSLGDSEEWQELRPATTPVSEAPTKKVCAQCNGTGVNGRFPDDYWMCECTFSDAPLKSAAAPVSEAGQAQTFANDGRKCWNCGGVGEPCYDGGTPWCVKCGVVDNPSKPEPRQEPPQ